MNDEYYMQCAIAEASFGLKNNHGGPFGAVVVLDDKIVGRGHNMVTSTNDPTAHAEVVAIRNACKSLNTFHLQDAVMYTSCEPCPMCMSAIYWANIKTVFYCYNRNDAANIGFSDNFIYDEIGMPLNERTVKMNRVAIDNDLFSDWEGKEDRIDY